MSIISSLCVENKKTCFLIILKIWTYTVFRLSYSIILPIVTRDVRFIL